MNVIGTSFWCLNDFVIDFSVVSSAGLLMTSPMDATVLDPDCPPRTRSNDLAKALMPTLDK